MIKENDHNITHCLHDNEKLDDFWKVFIIAMIQWKIQGSPPTLNNQNSTSKHKYVVLETFYVLTIILVFCQEVLWGTKLRIPF